MDVYQQEFINNLKKYRKLAGYSQSKLSELCNVSNGTIGNIECGASKPSFDLILTLAKVLNVHPALLFTAKIPADSTNTDLNAANQMDRAFLLDLYSKLKSHLDLTHK